MLQSIIWIAHNDVPAGQSAVGLITWRCPQAVTPRQAVVANSGRKKEISMSTTVPTTWQINVSLTLQGGSFRVVRMPASITLNFAEIPRERPEDSGHLAREWRRARRNTESERSRLMLAILLIVILAFVLMGAMPTWPYSRSWGYMPSGMLGVLLVVVLILLLLGRI